ncbi:translation initiation factor eIF-2B alpha/beta/delta subunit family protein [Picrophilus oshimae]|uniref:Translation initiation factor eIF-2B subunit delta n=1 Tax=Picrophilus torridus (strain ATCC 700027 / DSM 9790 / JCM 10055 / NBRC 100828 / KAW 2/3) TaxID=1122961 RepID=A0A8G2L746_PICTO|nr:hypothetical protein [Picrophilus oshimae]SMD30580.1 translation initiation factor eIF-2B subunit delta [Picrophilus oshimae DSM 9789]
MNVKDLYDNKASGTAVAFKIIDFFSHNDIDENIIKDLKKYYFGIGLINYVCDSIISGRKKNLKEGIEKHDKMAIEHAKPLFNDSVIGTISFSSQVLKAFISNREKIKRVYILESMPEREGIDFASLLVKNGIDVVLLHDASIYELSLNVDFCIVGSDTVAYNGGLIHKNGTYPMALSMKYFKKPFYSITISEKINRNFLESSYKNIKNHDWNIDIPYINRFFDYTPPDLIDYYINENGFVKPSDVNI